MAGSLNYGHNNPYIENAILDYLSENNIINASDLYTEPKTDCQITFTERFLKPRHLDYKVMCCGPTGTNAIEAALKLAKKNKRITNVFAFSGTFHDDMTLGSLALTTDQVSRKGAGIPWNNVSG